MQAIEIFNRHQDEITVAVIVSGLPTLGGWEAIQKMREIRPSLKTLNCLSLRPSEP